MVNIDAISVYFDVQELIGEFRKFVVYEGPTFLRTCAHRHNFDWCRTETQYYLSANLIRRGRVHRPIIRAEVKYKAV